MKRVGLLAVVTTALFALVVITPWGDFQGHPHWDEVGWIPFAPPPIRIRDVVLNFMLFTPLGITSALHFRRPILAAGLIALVVSLSGEWLQVYSHARFPSATDLVCNIAGAAVTAWIVRRRGQSPPA
jgi:glycopeptide antibiotics resistance protein